MGDASSRLELVSFAGVASPHRSPAEAGVPSGGPRDDHQLSLSGGLKLGYSGSAAGGAFEEQLALAGVAGQRGRPLELGSSLIEPPEFGEQVAAHARQEMVRLQRRLRHQ